MKKLKLLKNIFFYGFCIIMATCFLSLIVTKISTGKATVFGYRPIFVITGSMEPTINAKSFVIVKPIDAEDVKIGDIVTYNTNGKTIIHRVIDITEEGMFVFQGDNNASPDSLVSSEQIGYIVIWMP